MSAPPEELDTSPGPTFVVSSEAPAVLHVDPPFVELGWGKGGETTRLFARVEEAGNEALVVAARELIAQAKLCSQDLILCLGAACFESRQVLLAHLPELEARAVLARRAANGLGVGLEETLFWAQRCQPPLEGSESAQATWLVYSRRRSDHFDLLQRLRKAGIRIQRAVAGREALIHLLDSVDGDQGQILVTTTGRAVYAHLFRGRDLVQESRLALTSFSARSSTYTNIVQDVRQLTAFWSKGSRGAPLGGLHLFGFTSEEVESLSTPLSIASQGAPLFRLASPDGGSYEAHRELLLGLFRQLGRKSTDLRIPLPPRKSRIGATALALTTLTAFGSWRLVEHWSGRIAERRQEIGILMKATKGIEDGQDRKSSYLAARSGLNESIASLESISRRGLPLESALSHLSSTLGSRARITHVKLEQEEGGTRVVLEASLPDRAEHAAGRLDELRRVVGNDPRFSDIAVEPSSRVPDSDRGERLSFTFTSLYRPRG